MDNSKIFFIVIKIYHNLIFIVDILLQRKMSGAITLENLTPICKSCNCSMWTYNLDEFKIFILKMNKSSFFFIKTVIIITLLYILNFKNKNISLSVINYPIYM